MENSWESRSYLLVGKENIEELHNKKVMVFGVGGVGGYCVEALARSGIGELFLIDGDDVDESNINRQIIALNSTVSKSKVELFKQRILDINPSCKVKILHEFITRENISILDFSAYDYIVDAIDTISTKVEIVLKALQNNVKIISSMGTANKLDPSKLMISDIYKTSYDHLAKVMRKLLREKNVPSLDVVYSTEEPYSNNYIDENNKRKCGSMMMVPASAGLLIASYVIKNLICSNGGK